MTPLETGPAYWVGYLGSTLVVIWVVYRIARRLFSDVVGGLRGD